MARVGEGFKVWVGLGVETGGFHWRARRNRLVVLIYVANSLKALRFVKMGVSWFCTLIHLRSAKRVWRCVMNFLQRRRKCSVVLSCLQTG